MKINVLTTDTGIVYGTIEYADDDHKTAAHVKNWAAHRILAKIEKIIAANTGPRRIK